MAVVMIKGMRAGLIGLILTVSAPATASDEALSCEALLYNMRVRSVVVQNMQRTMDFPGQWAAASQSIMIQLIAHFRYNHLDFHYFETLLRQENFPLYLVANSLPLEPGLRIEYPSPLTELRPGKPAQYYLWVGVNGKAEADAFKRYLGVTDEQNLERLMVTGNIAVDDMDALNSANSSLIDPALSEEFKNRRKRPTDLHDN